MYTYAIRAVKQERFDDVDEEALVRALNPEAYPQQPQRGGGGGVGRCALAYNESSSYSCSSSRFDVAACPSNALALSNCIIVNPNDFQNGQHVVVNGAFGLTAR